MTKRKDAPVVPLIEHYPMNMWFSDETGARWSVARLIAESQDLPIFECPLAAMNLADKIWGDSNLLDMAHHMRVVSQADLSYPILLTWDGMIADGRHRIIKALAECRTHIPAKRFTWRLEPCRPAPEEDE